MSEVQQVQRGLRVLCHKCDSKLEFKTLPQSGRAKCPQCGVVLQISTDSRPPKTRNVARFMGISPAPVAAAENLSPAAETGVSALNWSLFGAVAALAIAGVAFWGAMMLGGFDKRVPEKTPAVAQPGEREGKPEAVVPPAVNQRVEKPDVVDPRHVVDNDGQNRQPRGDHFGKDKQQGPAHRPIRSIPAIGDLIVNLEVPGNVSGQVTRFCDQTQRLAIPLDDGTIRIWDLENRRETAALSEASGELIISADGKRLAAPLAVVNSRGDRPSLDRTRLGVWDVGTSRLIAKFENLPGNVEAFAIAPQGSDVFLRIRTGKDPVQHVFLRGVVATGKLVGLTRLDAVGGHRPADRSRSPLLASADGSFLVTTSPAGEFQRIDVKTGDVSPPQRPTAGRILSAALTPDGTRLVAVIGATDDGEAYGSRKNRNQVHVLQLPDLRIERTLPIDVNQTSPLEVRINAGGMIEVLERSQHDHSSSRLRVSTWSAEGEPQNVVPLAGSRAGSLGGWAGELKELVEITGQTIHVRTFENINRELAANPLAEFKHTSPVVSALLTADGGRLVVSTKELKFVVYDLQAGKRSSRTGTARFSQPGSISDVRWAAEVGPNHVIGTSLGDRLQVLDFESGAFQENPLNLEQSSFRDVLSRSQNQIVVFASSRGTPSESSLIEFLADGKVLRRLHVSNEPDATGIRLSPEGRIAIFGSKGVTLVDSELSIQRKLPRPGYVRTVAWTPDGSRLVVVGTVESDVTVWDVSTLQEVGRFRVPHAVKHVAVSPSGRTIVVQGLAREGNDETGQFTAWDAATFRQKGRVIVQMPGTAAGRNTATDLTALQFSSDGQWLLTAGTDGVVRFWDAPEIDK